MTVKMDQMRTAILCVNLVVWQPWTPMSKAEQQDMGKAELSIYYLYSKSWSTP